MSDAATIKDRARHCLDAGELDEALTHVDAGAALDAEDPAWEWMRGAVYQLRGNRPAAAAAYDQAIRRSVARGESARALGYGSLLRQLDPEHEVLGWLARWVAADMVGEQVGEEVPPPPVTPFFKELDYHEVLEVLSYAETRSLEAGALLIDRDEPGDTLYLVGDGMLRIELPEGDDAQPTAGPGDVVGELAFFERRTHATPVRAETPATVLAISRSDLEEEIIPQYERVRDALHGLYRERVVEKLLRVREPYTHLSEEWRLRLSAAGAWVTLADGDHIFRAGQPLDDLYLLKSGFVEITAGDTLVSMLSPGEFMGMVAVMRESLSLADARCAGEVEAVRFPGALVRKAAASTSEIQQIFEQDAQQREIELSDALA